MHSFSSSRRSSASGGSFTVRTGGKHFIPVHAPLGVGTLSKYIEPRPPRYETEYEAAFKWPPRCAYPAVPVIETVSTPSQPVNNWQSLLNAVTDLLGMGYETHLMEALREPVADRRLNLVLEYVYARFTDTLAAVDLHKLENGEDPESPSNDVLNLCRQFISAVRAIKAY